MSDSLCLLDFLLAIEGKNLRKIKVTSTNKKKKINSLIDYNQMVEIEAVIEVNKR